MDTQYIETDRLPAHDEDGGVYEVVEYQIVITLTIDSARRKTRGGLVYRLADGRDVTRVNSMYFYIKEEDQIIKMGRRANASTSGLGSAAG